MSTSALLASADLGQQLASAAADIDELFDDLLVPVAHTGSRLVNAMRYAAMGGGKRLRPILVCAAGDLFGVPRARSIRAGLAVESIHVQSLIHDDLPSMDNDGLRRGKPTVHIAFDEATAVLAGDSLLAAAFGILADEKTHPEGKRRCELVQELARAAGAWGMAGGQMIDLSPMQADDLDAITRLERLKTGALISWSVDAGAILGGAGSDARLCLRRYAQDLGLAFQIADDLLDSCGDEEAVGKRLRKDQRQGKHTFVSLLGDARARQQAQMLAEQAIDHLHAFDARAELLRAIAHFAVSRDR